LEKSPWNQSTEQIKWKVFYAGLKKHIENKNEYKHHHQGVKPGPGIAKD
jgi:hypothetical protein